MFWFLDSLLVDFFLICCFVHILWNCHLVFLHAIFDGSTKTSYKFKSRHFSFWFPLILPLAPSLLWQKHVFCCPFPYKMVVAKSLFIVGVFSSSTTIGVEKLISFDSNLIVPKPKKAKKAKWELNKVFQDI